MWFVALFEIYEGKIKRREPIPLLCMCAWTVVPDRTVLYLSRQHILTRASVPVT